MVSLLCVLGLGLHAVGYLLLKCHVLLKCPCYYLTISLVYIWDNVMLYTDFICINYDNALLLIFWSLCLAILLFFYSWKKLLNLASRHNKIITFILYNFTASLFCPSLTLLILILLLYLIIIFWKWTVNSCYSNCRKTCMFYAHTRRQRSHMVCVKGHTW